MAANEVTKKLLIYHTLYQLNVSFTNILKHCQKLRDGGILTARQMTLFLGYTKELQAEINEGALETLSDLEFNDWTRFGKIREKEEKRLMGIENIPIHAKKVQKKNIRNEVSRLQVCQLS